MVLLSVEQSVHPDTKLPTGMAKNTFLFQFSDYFMVNMKGSLACDTVYGNGRLRSDTGFMEHLHTTVSKFYDSVRTISEETNEKFTRYEMFESLFYGHFKGVDENIPLELFTSLRISEELYLVPECNCDDITKSLLRDYPELNHPKLVNFIPGEFLWQTAPGTYLTNYFAEEPKRVKLTFEEFTDYLGLKKETQPDEMEAARLAFDQPILLKNPKNKNKSAGMVNDGTTKEERKAMKLQRRADRNNA